MSNIQPSYIDTTLNYGERMDRLGRMIFETFIVMMILAVISGILTFIPLAVYKYYSANNVGVFSEEVIESVSFNPVSTTEYISDLDIQEKREVAALVNYVAEEIIAKHNRKVPNAEELAFQIVTESLIAEEDPFFITAVILAESTFKDTARSSVGALGLMQIMPHTGKYVSNLLSMDWDGKESLKDPETNLKLGISYIKYLKEKYSGNVDKTLVAYNWGPGNLAKKPGSIPSVSRKYSRKIQKFHNLWSLDYASREHEFQYRTLKTVYS